MNNTNPGLEGAFLRWIAAGFILVTGLAAGTACMADIVDTDDRPLQISSALANQSPQLPQDRANVRESVNQARDSVADTPWKLSGATGLAVTPAVKRIPERVGADPKTPAVVQASTSAANTTVAASSATVTTELAPAPSMGSQIVKPVVADVPPATAGAVPAMSAVSDARVWTVLRDQKSLRATLAVWAQAAGWSLSWEIPMDFILDADASFSGTFEQAVTAIGSGSWADAHPFQAIFYRGNKVLRIVNAGVLK